jgi:hypothetical protein
MQRQYQTVENRDVVAERSIVEADFYAKRFKEFLFERVFHLADEEISTNPLPLPSSESFIYPPLPLFNQ